MSFLSAPVMPAELVGRWQGFVDLAARLLGVRSVLMARLRGMTLEILLASRLQDNPHRPGDKVHLGVGHFCEEVFRSRGEVIIHDARTQARWVNGPCFRQGLIAYHGVPLLTPDGEFFGALCTLDDKVSLHSDADRDIIRRLGKQIEDDIGLREDLERSHHEAQLVRQDRDLVSAILDTADALVVVLDMEGRIVRFNRACERVTEYSSKDVVGKRLWDLFLLPEETEPVKKVFAGLRGGVFPNQHENHWLTQSGGRRLIAWSNTALTDSAGNVRYVIGTGLDITEQRKAQQERERLQEHIHQLKRMEAVGQLATGVAHDFSNLLTVILSCSDRLQKTKDMDEATRQSLLASIDQAARQASNVTRSLLTLSRGVAVERQPVVLAEVIEECQELLRRLLPANVELRIELGPDHSLTVDADRAQLQQVLINLAMNAGDAMPDGGELTISLAPFVSEDGYVREGRAGEARIRVRDTGVGMPPEVQQRIFEPFFTTKPRGRGTGLGLAIVDPIVKAHGGRIRLDSHPGKGSTFDVVLPCLPANAGTIGETERPALSGKGESVLVLEGGACLRGLIAQTLRQAGYLVVAAADCAEANARLERDRGVIRVVVVDLDHIEGQGADWIDRMRAAGFKIPLVVIAAGSALDCEREDTGASTFLGKPFQPADLVKTIQWMLGQESVQEEVVR